MSKRKIKITKFPKVSGRKAHLAKYGEVEEVNFEELGEKIEESAWSPVVFKDNSRNNENFIEASVIGLDFDGAAKVEEVIGRIRDLKLNYCVSYSHNHRKEKHGTVADRFRIVFPLEKTIKDRRIYEKTLKSALEIFPEADQQCNDSSRFFFNSVGGEYFNNGSNYPISSVGRVEKKNNGKSSHLGDFCILGSDALYFLKNAESGLPGEWNDSLNKAAFSLGLGNVPHDLAMRLIEGASPSTLDKKDIKTFSSGYRSGEKEFAKTGGNTSLIQKLGVKGKKPDAEGVYLMLEDELRDKFYVQEDDKGRRNVILRDMGGKLVCKSDRSAIASILVRLVKNDYHYFLTATEAEKHVDNWICYTDPLSEEPRSVAFSDEDVFAYHKLDFYPKNMDTPVFDEFIGRCTNGEAVMAYVWSIFENESDRQQYLWMYGDGLNGKSSLAEVLSRCLGNAYMSKSAINSYNNKNFTSTLVSKRLAVFSDCNSTGFVRSEQFKELTGGDKIEVEFKYEAAYSAILDTKFIFFSNFLPQLSSKKADVRRIILSEVSAITGSPDPTYVEKLWGEIEGILFKCREAYRKIVVDHGFIPCDTTSIENIASDTEIAYESIFSTYFEERDRGIYLTGVQVYDIIRGALRSHGVKLSNFKDWLIRKKGIEISNKNKTREQRYLGLGVKDYD